MSKSLQQVRPKPIFNLQKPISELPSADTTHLSIEFTPIGLHFANILSTSRRCVTEATQVPCGTLLNLSKERYRKMSFHYLSSRNLKEMQGTLQESLIHQENNNVCVDKGTKMFGSIVPSPRAEAKTSNESGYCIETWSECQVLLPKRALVNTHSTSTLNFIANCHLL